MTAFEIFSLSVSVIYFVFILFVIVGFYRKKEIKNYLLSKAKKSHSTEKGISVLIPFKDEENNLPLLISSLSNQDYTLAEIIFIDDHSTDDSVQILSQFTHPRFAIKILKLESQEMGKKAAIEMGVKNSTYDLILTTDADCTFSNTWIRTYAEYLSEENEVVTGPVEIKNEIGFWNKFQQLEMISIQTVSYAMGNLGEPISMSGANLSYKKEIFNRLDPYSKNHDTPSGDDIYYLQLLKKNGIGICFLKNQETQVKTVGSTFSGYFRQRIRWMKKSSSFKDPMTILIGIIIFVSSMNFIFIAGNQLFTKEWNDLLLFSAGLKIIVDFLLLFLVTHHWKKRELMFWFPPVFLMNVCFTTVIPIFGWWIPVSWKGRKI